MFSSKLQNRRFSSSKELTRKSMKINLIEISINEYLVEKDNALSPLDDIDIEENESYQPEEYNENVLVYSNRTEASIYDSELNFFLKNNCDI